MVLWQYIEMLSSVFFVLIFSSAQWLLWLKGGAGFESRGCVDLFFAVFLVSPTVVVVVIDWVGVDVAVVVVECLLFAVGLCVSGVSSVVTLSLLLIAPAMAVDTVCKPCFGLPGLGG